MAVRHAVSTVAMNHLRKASLAISLLLASWSIQAGGNFELAQCLTGQVRSTSCDQTIKRYWQHQPTVVAAARAEGIEPALLMAVTAIESRFNHEATSPKGARGLTQVMPMTGAAMGVNDDRWLYYPETNLRLGARYLATQWRQFRNWELALAAYNAGPGAVQRYGGIPPYAETQAYVREVLWMYRLMRPYMMASASTH